MARPKTKDFQNVAIKMEQAVYDRLCTYCDKEKLRKLQSKTCEPALPQCRFFDLLSTVKLKK